tara:strand:+ start:401 stop:1264 length:864 start_codon:yes stop_codon:yes gene_type:complete
MGFINELTIIIVLFEEKKELLFKCLHNIKNFKVIIIDNAGNSELRDQVQEEFVIQHYILNKKNYGFTKAANQAIKLCNTDYILNINADCFIQAQDILLLVKAHQNYDNCFIAAPTFYNDNHELTDNSDCFHEKNLNREILNLEGDVCVDIVLGSAILFKKKDMIALGLLDENYFLYFVDYDLCRMIKQKNKSVIQVFNSKAQHSHGQSKVKNALKRTFLRSYHFTYDEMCYYYKINKHHEKYKNLKKKIPSYIVKTIFNFIIFRINKSINFFSMIKAFYDFNRLIKK